MKGQEERRSTRKKKTPLPELHEALDQKKEEFTSQLEEINLKLAEEDYAAIQELRRVFRTTHQQFRATSLELSRRLHGEGRVQESGAADEDRQILREEFESCRAKLIALGLAGSSASSDYRSTHRSIVSWMEDGRRSLKNLEDEEIDADNTGFRTPPRLPDGDVSHLGDFEAHRTFPPPRQLERRWSFGDLRREEHAPSNRRTQQDALPRMLALPPQCPGGTFRRTSTRPMPRALCGLRT